MTLTRTPLREAIEVLDAKGLVTMKMRRGAYVSHPHVHKDACDHLRCDT